MFYSRGLGVGLNIFTGGGISVQDCGIPAATRFPSTYYPRNPWFVKAWDGKIWVANGNANNTGPNPNSGSGMVSYNPSNNTSTLEYTNSDEQIFTFREINGELWAAGGDKDAGGSNQWLYKYASGSWSKYEVIPFSEHAYDLCEYDSKVWSVGGTTGNGLAYSSDLGATWTLVSTNTFVSRIYKVFSFGGDLWMSTNGNGGWTYTNPPPVYTGALWLYKLSGTTIAKHTTDLAPGTGETGVEFNIRSWAEINSKLVYTVGPHAADHQVEGKYLFSANSTLTSTTRITLDTNEQAWDIKKNGGTVYVLTAMPNGSGGYTTRIRTTTDGTNFPVYFEITTTSFGMSFDILNGEFYIAQGYDLYGNATSTETGRLYRVTL